MTASREGGLGSGLGVGVVVNRVLGDGSIVGLVVGVAVGRGNRKLMDYAREDNCDKMMNRSMGGGWLRLYAGEGRGGRGINNTDDQSIQLIFNSGQSGGGQGR
jgi:hypothetical protein